MDISSTISTDFKFGGLRLRATARESLLPLNADGVGVFDPSGQQLRPGGHQLDHLYGLQIFAGAATASNGKIIFSPYTGGWRGCI